MKSFLFRWLLARAPEAATGSCLDVLGSWGTRTHYFIVGTICRDCAGTVRVSRGTRRLVAGQGERREERLSDGRQRNDLRTSLMARVCMCKYY
jgi:hypothetical protein